MQPKRTPKGKSRKSRVEDEDSEWETITPKKKTKTQHNRSKEIQKVEH